MLISEVMMEVREVGYVDGASRSFLGLGIGYRFSLTPTDQTEHEGRVVLKTNPRTDAQGREIVSSQLLRTPACRL